MHETELFEVGVKIKASSSLVHVEFFAPNLAATSESLVTFVLRNRQWSKVKHYRKPVLLLPKRFMTFLNSANEMCKLSKCTPCRCFRYLELPTIPVSKVELGSCFAFACLRTSSSSVLTRIFRNSSPLHFLSIKSRKRPTCPSQNPSSTFDLSPLPPRGALVFRLLPAPLANATISGVPTIF